MRSAQHTYWYTITEMPDGSFNCHCSCGWWRYGLSSLRAARAAVVRHRTLGMSA